MNQDELKISAQIKTTLQKLKKKNLSLATVESITGGGIGSAITAIPGSSEVYLGGLITYSDSAKIKILGVDQKTLKKHTAVSEEVVVEMVKAVSTIFKSNVAIATTGVAGPGKSYGQKAGIAWIGIKAGKKIYATKVDLSAGIPGKSPLEKRDFVRKVVIATAFSTLARIL